MSKAASRNALPEEPKAVVSYVLRQLRIARLARPMFVMWPATEALTEDVAAHLGLMAPHPSGRSLLEEAMVTAFQQMVDAHSTSEDPFSDDVRLAYMRGLLRHLLLVFEVEAHGEDGAIWDPLQDEGLPRWTKRHGLARIGLYRELPERLAAYRPDALGAALLYHLLSANSRRELLPILPTLTAYAD